MTLLQSLPLLLAGISLTFSLGGEDELVTLPFGDGIGDHLGPFGPDAVSEEIQLLGTYIFYGREESSLFISENGVISFRQPFSDPFPRDLPISSDAELPAPAFIAGFWGDINVVKNDGVIFFSEMDANNRRFARSKTHVLNLLREGYGGSLEGFNPTHIFQATWETVHQNDPGIFNRAVTFQIVLVTDSRKSYALLLYSDVRWDESNGHGVLVGFNAGDGERSFTHQLHRDDRILELDFETNARSNGAFVYRIDQAARIIEPTDDQRGQDICVLSVREEGGEIAFDCSCPTEEKPVLSVNQINCLPKPLAVEFFNNTPSVYGDSVTAYIRSNRPGIQITCQLPRTEKRKKEDCSSGIFYYSGMQPKSYSLRVVASDPTTNERVILRGYFTIAGKKESADEKDFCGVTIVNKGTEVKHDEVTVEFTGTEAVMSFECRLAGGQNQPCESPFILKDLAPGNHRVVVVPRGCDRKNRKAASVRFTVKE